ncbi:hypothetical protein MTO96_023433 [Rhipicephalus appendiculatus]
MIWPQHRTPDIGKLRQGWTLLLSKLTMTDPVGPCNTTLHRGPNVIGVYLTDTVTPYGAGHASVDPVDCARKLDEQHDTTLKAMPHISKSVLRPNGFEKMRVNYAARLYSDEVLRGLFLYNEIIKEKHGSTAATVNFVKKKMRRLIEAMTSRCSSGAPKPGGTHEKCTENFLAYLDKWETAAGSRGFLGHSTAEGLRVTLSSPLNLLRYPTKKLNFSYMMTCRLSQHPLERLFGIVRQMSGCNDHSTPTQFLISVNTLGFQNLAKPPKGSNVSSGLLRSLLGADNGKDPTSRRKLDELLDARNLAEAHEVLSECTSCASTATAPRMLTW